MRSVFTHCLIFFHTSMLQAGCFYHLEKELNSCEFQNLEAYIKFQYFKEKSKETVENTFIFLKVIPEFSQASRKFSFMSKKNWTGKYWQAILSQSGKILQFSRAPSATCWCSGPSASAVSRGWWETNVLGPTVRPLCLRIFLLLSKHLLPWIFVHLSELYAFE